MAKLADFMLKKKFHEKDAPDFSQFIATYCSEYDGHWPFWKVILTEDTWSRTAIWKCVLQRQEAQLKLILNKIG